MYQLEVSHIAHRQVLRLPSQTRERVNKAIAALSDNPRPSGVKKLTAKEGYRIRVGDYRILYVIDDKEKLIIVYRVAGRGEVYRQ